ncbi:MAG: metallophosphoesterase [Thermoplasmata archaeon]
MSKKYKINVNYDIYSEEDFLKDCPNSQFIPTILPPVKRIIAIGDIHGDLELSIRSFKLANLIDNNLNWIANPPDTVVVQVGDQIDSYRPNYPKNVCRKKHDLDDRPDDINVINFFDEMHKKASKVGGAVYSLIGNHELMNVMGDFRYVSNENLYNFKYFSNGKIYLGKKGRKDAFKPGGPLAKHIACTRNSVIIIGSTMFVHAGILPALVKQLEYLEIDNQTKLKYLNAIVRKWLLHKLTERAKISKKVNISKRVISSIINDANLSPFWTRIFGLIPEGKELNSPECFESIKETLEVFKIGHIVVGHTPQFFTSNDGINGTCYEKDSYRLYRIDGGFSRAFGISSKNRNIQVLEITDDKNFNIIEEKISDKRISKFIKSGR